MGINFGSFLVTAVTLIKIGDFIVEYLREFEAIFKKALTSVPVAFGESCLICKNPKSKISCLGPLMPKFY
jgi:hypothetical protein